MNYPHKLPARCACGEPAIKKDSTGDGVCARCAEIERRLYVDHHPRVRRDLATMGGLEEYAVRLHVAMRL